MCEQLVAMGKTLGPEVVARQLLDELFELLKDEEVKVSGWVRPIRGGVWGEEVMVDWIQDEDHRRVERSGMEWAA